MTCLRILFGVLGMLICATANAAVSPFDGFQRASDQELDRMRGGFEVNVNGILAQIPFSLEQLTYLNGELVASMKLNIAGMTASLTKQIAQTPNDPVPSPPPTPPPDPPAPQHSDPAPTTLTAPVVAQVATGNQASLTLVQNGTGNKFELPQSLNGIANVIQNSVDNQVISQITIMNATISAQLLSAARQMSATFSQGFFASH